MYSPDGIERSRASANCAGSYLHSPWWSQQAYTASTTSNPLANVLGGLMAQLGNSLGNPLGGGQLMPPHQSWWGKLMP